MLLWGRLPRQTSGPKSAIPGSAGPFVVQDTRFARVGGYARMRLDRSRHQIQGGMRSGWVGQEDVKVIEEGPERFTLPQLRVCPAQRLMLTGEKGRGKGVALFATLSLAYALTMTPSWSHHSES